MTNTPGRTAEEIAKRAIASKECRYEWFGKPNNVCQCEVCIAKDALARMEAK